MKVAFYDTFNGDGAAEQEISQRLKYCFNKNNIEIVHLYNNSKVKNSEFHADNMNLDFCYAHEIVSTVDKVLPDCFTVFFHWAPTGFNGRYWCDTYLRYMNKFDIVVGGYETEDALFDIYNNNCNIYESKTKLYNITSSISKDFIIPPKKHENLRLFYIGINIESSETNMRYGNLIKYCDKNDLIDIYGPNKSFGRKGCWDGFKCYRGQIPLDGYSIIEKINNAGICLALNSPAHNAVGSVSNRTYEAAAAGAIIISDDNPYVRKYFGDSVFYIDTTLPEAIQIEKIKEILDFIKNNQEKAYLMACKSQEIFVKNLALDEQVSGLIPYVEKQKSLMSDKTLQTEIVDIICYIETLDDWKYLFKEIKKQYYKNIHLIVVSKDSTCSIIADNIEGDVDFVISKNFRGKTFTAIKKLMKGEYFIILDKYSALHKNHIYKAVNILKISDNLYCYSGAYIRYHNEKEEVTRYDTLNSRPIEQQYLLSYINPYTHPELALAIEKNCPTACFVFKKEILNYAIEQEYQQVSVDMQLYLASCSNIKAKKLGKFMYSLTAGYKLKEGDDIDKEIFSHNQIYYTQGKYQNTYMKELGGIFAKYDIEISYDKEENKKFEINKYSKVIINKMNKSEKFRKLLSKFYKNIETKNNEKELDLYLQRKKIIQYFLYFLIKKGVFNE